MDENIEIGILLIRKEDNEQMGLVVLDPSGMMIYTILKEGMHPYGMKPIERFFSDSYTGEELSAKYAAQINEFGKVPDDILWGEAIHISDAMNIHGISVAAKSALAKAVKFRSFPSQRRIVILENN